MVWDSRYSLHSSNKHCRSQWKALFLKASFSNNSTLRLILQLPSELKTRWRSAKECPEKIYWEKKNVMKCDICGIRVVSFLKQFGSICGSTTVGLKHLEHFWNYLKRFTEYRAQSIWEKYSEKLFGRNTHLMVSTFTGFKYRRKYVIPAQLQNLIMQYYAFSGIVFFILQSFFFESFLFSLSSVCNVSCLFENSNAEKKDAIR